MGTSGKYNRKWLRLAFLLYPLASVLCFIFPSIPSSYINKILGRLKGFKGSIKRIHFKPFAIQITISGLVLDKVNKLTSQRSMFLSIEELQVNIDWRKLWAGKIEGSVKCNGPSVTLAKNQFADTDMNIQGNPLYQADLGMDITVSRLEIDTGRFEYADITTDPKTLLLLENISLQASNISTSLNSAGNYLSDIILKADIYEGKLAANMKVNLFSRSPDFNLNAGVSNMNMVLLNPFFQAYAKFDVNSGTMSMRSEIKAASERFKGHVESVIKDLDIVGPEDKNDNLGRYLWESLLGVAMELLKDHTKDQLSARINIDQPFKNADINIGLAVLEVVKNAFVNGLTPFMGNTVKVNLK